MRPNQVALMHALLSNFRQECFHCRQECENLILLVFCIDSETVVTADVIASLVQLVIAVTECCLLQ